MAEELHNLSEKLPDDGQPKGPATPAEPDQHNPPPIDFEHAPVTGSARITAMNVHEAHQAVQLLRGALQDIRDAHRHCAILEDIAGPGLEPASEEYAKNARANGAKHQRANQQLQANIQHEIDNLQAAINQVTSTEETNTENLRKLT